MERQATQPAAVLTGRTTQPAAVLTGRKRRRVCAKEKKTRNKKPKT